MQWDMRSTFTNVAENNLRYYEEVKLFLINLGFFLLFQWRSPWVLCKRSFSILVQTFDNLGISFCGNSEAVLLNLTDFKQNIFYCAQVIDPEFIIDRGQSCFTNHDNLEHDFQFNVSCYISVWKHFAVRAWRSPLEGSDLYEENLSVWFHQIFIFSSNAAGNFLGKNFQEYMLGRRIWKHITKYIKHSLKFPHGEHNVDWNAHFENIPDVLKFLK